MSMRIHASMAVMHYGHQLVSSSRNFQRELIKQFLSMELLVTFVFLCIPVLWGGI